jgi:hypothetical protein
MLVNIMVFKLVLIKACFDPLSYYFFLNLHPIVNKKSMEWKIWLSLQYQKTITLNRTINVFYH